MSEQTASPGKLFTAGVQQKILNIPDRLVTSIFSGEDMTVQQHSQTRLMFIRSIAARKSLNKPLRGFVDYKFIVL